MNSMPEIITAFGNLNALHAILAVITALLIFRPEWAAKAKAFMSRRPAAPNGNGAAKAALQRADSAHLRQDSHEAECVRRHEDTSDKFSVLFKRMNRVEKDVSFIRGAITTRWGIKPTDD